MRRAAETTGAVPMSAMPVCAPSLFVPAVIGPAPFPVAADVPPTRKRGRGRSSRATAVEMEIDGVTVKTARDTEPCVIDALKTPR